MLLKTLALCALVSLAYAQEKFTIERDGQEVLSVDSNGNTWVKSITASGESFPGCGNDFQPCFINSPVDITSADCGRCYKSNCVVDSEASTSTTPITFTMDGSSDFRYSRVILGDNGFPLIVTNTQEYYYTGFPATAIFACNDAQCSSYDTNIQSGFNGNGDFKVSVALMNNAYPFIATSNGGDIFVISCTSENCSSAQKTIKPMTTTSSFADDIDVVIGSDGLPLVFTTDAANGDIHINHCSTQTCTSFDTSEEYDVGNDVGGSIRADVTYRGTASFVYANLATSYVAIRRCDDVECSSTSNASLVSFNGVPSGGEIDFKSSPSSGYPTIVFTDKTSGQLKFVNCHDVKCTSKTIVNILPGVNSSMASLAYGPSKLPWIAAANYLVKCDDFACSSYSSIQTTPTVEQEWLDLVVNEQEVPFVVWDTSSGDLKAYTPMCNL